MAQSESAYLAVVEDLSRLMAIYLHNVPNAWASADARVIHDRVTKNIARLRQELSRGEAAA
jgi:hypothetical protein